MLRRPFYLQSSRGASLIEMVLSLALMGLIVIPAIFLSSAWFSQQLLNTRASLAVNHNVSQWVHRFSTEISQTVRLLPRSDAKHVFFAFEDPMSRQVIRRGYRLKTRIEEEQSGPVAAQILEQLYFDPERQSWLPETPYSVEQASAFALPLDARFQYCLGRRCDQPATQATHIRLEGWAFTTKASSVKGEDAQRNGPESLALPPLSFRLSSSEAEAGAPLLAEQPRQLVSFLLAGSLQNTSPRLTALSQDGQRLVALIRPYSSTPGLTRLTLTGTTVGQRFSMPSFPSSATAPTIGLDVGRGSDVFLLNATSASHRQPTEIRRFRVDPKVRAGFRQTTTYPIQVPGAAWADFALDEASSSFVLLDSVHKALHRVPMAPREDSGSLSPRASSFPAVMYLPYIRFPSSVAVSERTGNILVLDSEQRSSQRLSLFILSPQGERLEEVAIDLKQLTPFPKTSQPFRMLYDEVGNRLVLVGLNTGWVYTLILPSRLS